LRKPIVGHKEKALTIRGTLIPGTNPNLFLLSRGVSKTKRTKLKVGGLLLSFCDDYRQLGVICLKG
jgi:hypothetical protein